MTGIVRPKLVATDLDGTFCGSDGHVSERAGAAAAALIADGIEVVFVTARPPRWVDDLLPHVGTHGIAICTNGAFVYDVVNATVLSWSCFPTGAPAELIADLREGVPGIAFLVETATGGRYEPSYAPLADHPLSDVAEGDVTAIDDRVGKLVARTPDLGPEEFLARVVEVVGERAHVQFSGAVGLAEIGPPGVTKATTLAAWCAGHGIDAADVWAFGDMPNDLAMLAWAGTSFAVANAHPDVRAAADRLCGSNADDGVAAVMESIVARGMLGG